METTFTIVMIITIIQYDLIQNPSYLRIMAEISIAKSWKNYVGSHEYASMGFRKRELDAAFQYHHGN